MLRIVLLCVLLVFSWVSYAAPVCVITTDAVPGNGVAINGPVSCGEGVVPKVTTFGPLTMNDTTVTDQVVVWGSAEFNHARLTESIIYGPVIARYTSFNDSLIVRGNEILLMHSKTHNIQIENELTSPSLPTLILKHSVVNGSVRFYGRIAGLVLMDKGSVITGEIINGRKALLF